MVSQRILQDASGRVTLSDRVADLLAAASWLSESPSWCLFDYVSVRLPACLSVAQGRMYRKTSRSAAEWWWVGSVDG
jgi:hypothetical protein